ncbi:aminopeptidase P family protein [Candidatus Entotheonella palauensis]|nr:aminopeptidase P family protein [Candidatus Entotheonella palauensis]
MTQNTDSNQDRLDAICRLLSDHGVDAYVVPSADAHLNEYPVAYQRRRQAISGFAGSAGDVLITPEESHLFVDSRYHLQAEQDVDTTRFHVHKVGLEGAYTLLTWLTELEKQRGALRVGFDPFVVPMDAHASYRNALKSAESALVPIHLNFVDEVWTDQPAMPAQPIYALPPDVTGRAPGEKLAGIRQEMAQQQADLLILTKLDEIAWVTNLRGSDVAYNPVFESYLVIDREQATCFARVMPPSDVQAAMAPDITFQPYAAYADAVKQQTQAGAVTVWLDASATTMGTRLLLPETARVIESRNPVVLAKATKNEVEVASSRNAHLHAAAAKIRSLARLERMLTAGQPVSEHAYATMLHEEYSSEEGFRDLSFTTIAAAGPNGAIVHYSEASPDVLLGDSELFLVDSGAQVLGGTTDDTRTVSTGAPTERQRRLFTLVLRSHIRLAMQKFPEGTSGAMLDALARSVLWNAGLDFGHGTGHGVGAFLNVHEGPQRISPNGDEPMRPGMIVSNEPGYYEEGWGGIRIENLYVVVPDDDMPPHPSGKRWFKLDPLTLIPFDNRLIDPEQLTDDEHAWLRQYYERVWDTVSPLLSGDDREWLQHACSEI